MCLEPPHCCPSQLRGDPLFVGVHVDLSTQPSIPPYLPLLLVLFKCCPSLQHLPLKLMSSRPGRERRQLPLGLRGVQDLSPGVLNLFLLRRRQSAVRLVTVAVQGFVDHTRLPPPATVTVCQPFRERVLD